MGDQTRKEDRKVRCVEFWETQLDFCVVSMQECMIVLSAINGTVSICGAVEALVGNITYWSP